MVTSGSKFRVLSILVLHYHLSFVCSLFFLFILALAVKLVSLISQKKKILLTKCIYMYSRLD